MQNENELNENKMSLTNMPAIIVPTPLPLVRAEDETNCPCSFCQKKRISVQELKEAIKEVPQIVALDTKRLEEMTCDILDELKAVTLMNEPIQEDEQWSTLTNSTLDWTDYNIWEEEDEEEEILLQPLTRSLQDFPIPTLSRSTNDPNMWEEIIF